MKLALKEIEFSRRLLRPLFNRRPAGPMDSPHPRCLRSVATPIRRARILVCLGRLTRNHILMRRKARPAVGLKHPVPQRVLPGQGPIRLRLCPGGHRHKAGKEWDIWRGQTRPSFRCPSLSTSLDAVVDVGALFQPNRLKSNQLPVAHPARKRYASDQTIPEISRRHIRVVSSVTHLMCLS